ncbi:MAG: ATP-dependent sacrificial sulfur transferase LarE [Nitrospirae bacterium]|nr:ATP-dependent sacrificial sulfur transferase LarE [Nitrospirota bacterium]
MQILPKKFGDKYEALLTYLRGLEGVVLAYSGGADSTFLLMAVRDSGVSALAVTAVSPSMSSSDLNAALDMVSAISVAHEIIHTDELNDENYSSNTPDRCFYCKSELFKKLKDIATAKGLPHVIDGSNIDDLGDYRPGLRAKASYGVISPLAEVGLTKAEIRQLSRCKGLKTWDRPSSPCLSSRLPYGEQITVSALRMVEQAEVVLKDLGFVNLRVRKHGDMARIELMDEDIAKAVRAEIKEVIIQRFREIGFLYVTLDMEGYRSGSLNRGLKAAGVSIS